jgi:hypothetical protein
MVTQLEKRSKKLYDVDYNLWVLETVKQLENREFNALDLDVSPVKLIDCLIYCRG